MRTWERSECIPPQKIVFDEASNVTKKDFKRLFKRVFKIPYRGFLWSWKEVSK